LARRILGEMVGCVACAAVMCVLSSAATGAIHRVTRGDTLWELAKKHHTTPAALAKANGIKENATLALGKTLIIPGKTRPHRISTESHRRARSTSCGPAVHTTRDGVCLRTGPGTQHRKIAVLPAGTSGKKLARQGNWLKIALRDGRCGYVYRPLVGLGPGTASKQIGTEPTARSTSSEAETELIRTALACRGARYRRGGTSRGGFDCSGFTRYVFAKYGVNLPHSSAAQSRIGRPVAKSELQPGDLVFFQTYRRGVSHVGIYIGNGRFVHASTHGRGVTVDSLNSAYYAPRYRGARRVR